MPDSPATKIIVLPEAEEEVLRYGIKKKLDKAIKIFNENPRHPSLHLEKLHPYSLNTYSIRLDIHFRAILIKDENGFIIIQVNNHYS